MHPHGHEKHTRSGAAETIAPITALSRPHDEVNNFCSACRYLADGLWKMARTDQVAVGGVRVHHFARSRLAPRPRASRFPHEGMPTKRPHLGDRWGRFDVCRAGKLPSEIARTLATVTPMRAPCACIAAVRRTRRQQCAPPRGMGRGASRGRRQTRRFPERRAG